MIQRCVECERRLPRSQFSCRIRAQFDTLPTAEEVDLQPRCMECTRLYAKRKRFEKKLKKFAASKGSWISLQKGSASRVLVLDRDASKQLEQEVREHIARFNNNLPYDCADIARHGVLLRILSAETAARQAHQLSIPLTFALEKSARARDPRDCEPSPQ